MEPGYTYVCSSAIVPIHTTRYALATKLTLSIVVFWVERAFVSVVT